LVRAARSSRLSAALCIFMSRSASSRSTFGSAVGGISPMYIYKWVMSHVWIRHGTYMIESCHKKKW